MFSDLSHQRVEKLYLQVNAPPAVDRGVQNSEVNPADVTADVTTNVNDDVITAAGDTIAVAMTSETRNDNEDSRNVEHASPDTSQPLAVCSTMPQLVGSF